MSSWEPKKSRGWALEIENTSRIDSKAKYFSDLTQRHGQADGVRGEVAPREPGLAAFPPPALQLKTV